MQTQIRMATSIPTVSLNDEPHYTDFTSPCKDGDTNHQYSPAERQQKKSTPPGGEKEAEFTLEGVYDVPAAPQEK